MAQAADTDRANRAQAVGQQQGHGAASGYGDPGRGIRHSACRGGGDDTEKAGGKELGRRGSGLAEGARGRAVAGDVLCGGIDVGRRFGSVRISGKRVSGS